MKVKSIAECSPWSILQYFWPALSDNRSWKPIYGPFESGRFRQVLLYITMMRFLSPCFFKKASGILQSPPSIPLSVRPSRYLLLNHWTKSNQIWCVSCSHEWGVQWQFFLPPPPPPPHPWGPGEGPKGQISWNIIKFQLQSQLQRFLNQTLCVFSQMKDIQHIRRDFHLATWVMGQGFGLGGTVGGCGCKKKNSEIQPDLVCELLTWMAHAPAQFFGSPPLGPWEGAKRSNIIKSEL